MKIRLPLLALAAAAAGCSSLDTDDAPTPLPERGYEVYTGDSDDAGDMYLGFTTYRHEPTGKTCVLLPVYHVATAAFYEAVQREMDRADVVLTEGVGGAPSLSPGLALTTYLFANYSRLASFGGLTMQSEAIVARPNQRNADLRLEEFQAGWPWHTPIVQGLVLPFLVVVMEPLVLGSWLERGLVAPFGGGDAFAASWRHFLVEDANDDDGPSDVLLPGVVDVRNERLLEEIDRAVADDEVAHIAVPWGAAHFPPMRDDLEERGWTEVGHEWVRAIPVRALLEGELTRDDESFDLMIPWALHVRGRSGESWSVSAALNSILVERRPTSDVHVGLLWELLLSLRSNPDGDHFELQLLPSLFGRPLLFQYVGDADDSRLRFLWFFEV